MLVTIGNTCTSGVQKPCLNLSFCTLVLPASHLLVVAKNVEFLCSMWKHGPVAHMPYGSAYSRIIRTDPLAGCVNRSPDTCL